MQKKLLFLVVVLFTMTLSVMAQVTTSGISGKITSMGEEVIGATVTATHQPSGTVYRAVTNVEGRFTIQGMRVGGPYKVEVAYIGQQTKTFENVNLRLGEVEDMSCSLEQDSKELQEVVVTGNTGINATKTGAAQSLTSKQIADMPSITHGIADVARLNPQLTTTNAGVMTYLVLPQMDPMEGKLVLSQSLWRQSIKFIAMLHLLMFDRADLPVALSTLLLSQVLTTFMVACMVLATTRV